jgi:hypothetical protein
MNVAEMTPYRPSCAFEGMDFMDRWCAKCEQDRAFREGTGDSCLIAANTMVYDVNDPAYPREWRQDGPSGPRCTAFIPIEGGPEPIDPGAVVRDMFP